MMRSVFRVVFLLVFVSIVLTAPSKNTKRTGGQCRRSTKRHKGSEIELKEVKNDNNITIQVGYMYDSKTFKKLYTSCISLDRLEVYYVEHELDSATRNKCSRIAFRQDSFNSGVNLEDLYVRENQKKVDLLRDYCDSDNYLARGHLAAMTDYVTEIDQLCTFYYINTAPQWQSFNNANWKSLEYRVRQHFVKPHYDTVIYSGTFDWLKLPDNKNNIKQVYLDNKKKIKVPLYFYKVVYDKLSGNGTAFIGVNNPFISESKAADLEFCTDHCHKNTAFNWLTWQPHIIRKGYSFCCTVADFRTHVLRFPALVTKGLLT